MLVQNISILILYQIIILPAGLSHASNGVIVFDKNPEKSIY